jgi:hypothetical protein
MWRVCIVLDWIGLNLHHSWDSVGPRGRILFKLENRNWTRLVQKPNWTETQGQK